LYLVGRFGPGMQAGTYRFDAGDLTTPTFVTHELMDLGGRLTGDFLYDLSGNIDQVAYTRVAKTGGAVQELLRAPMPFKSTAAARDALYALDAEGQVQRIRAPQDITRVARGDAEQAVAVVSDGDHVYLATGKNTDGGLFRILEGP
jgi:hypothetical protein